VLEATVDERLPRGLHDVSIGFGSDGCEEEEAVGDARKEKRA
jgi:hypothetical protein